MNKKIIIIFLSVIIANLSNAYSEDSLNKPALILRFNKENIYYENSLSMLISKTLNAKANAKFYLDLFAKNDQELNNLMTDAQNIIMQLENSNITKDHIFIRKTTDFNLNFGEIRISVN